MKSLDKSKIWAGDNKLKIKGMDGISFYDNINSYSSRELLDIKSSTVTLKGQRLTGLSTYNPTSDSGCYQKIC